MRLSSNGFVHRISFLAMAMMSLQLIEGFTTLTDPLHTLSPRRNIQDLKVMHFFREVHLRRHDVSPTHSSLASNAFATAIFFKSSSNDPNDVGQLLPKCIQSEVLKRVYPSILKHIEEYGNPNIPLGTSEGKKCKTLRRMAFEKKLSEEEVDLLTNLGFRWNSFEDVYEEADFDSCLKRLIDYEKETQSNYQIPKKYHPDPELGAWVIMIRRIGKDNIENSRRQKLDDIGFSWKSTRKCGSSFMNNYRFIKERLESCCSREVNGVNDETWSVVDSEGLDQILKDDKIYKWLKAQRKANELGNLSEPRCKYMDELPGVNWLKI